MYDIEKFWESFIKPAGILYNTANLTETYGKFYVEPFERGYGVTIGNSLRRVLLSSIPGAAIVAIKVESVLHEFTSIPGVVEDVPDIILNLKGIRVSIESEDNIVEGTLEVEGEGEVRAGDLSFPESVKVLTPDVHIATIATNGKLSMRLWVMRGKGYVPADRIREKFIEPSIDMIFIDADFSPVRKVAYHVTSARVGRVSDYDRLNMEIWTDGSVNPKDSLNYAAQLLIKHFEIFANILPAKEEEKKEEPTIDPMFYTPIEELKFPERAMNCLRNENIRYLGDLVQRSEAELLNIKNLGEKTLNEIKQILEGLGLSLGMNLEGWKTPDAAEEKKE